MTRLCRSRRLLGAAEAVLATFALVVVAGLPACGGGGGGEAGDGGGGEPGHEVAEFIGPEPLEAVDLSPEPGPESGEATEEDPGPDADPGHEAEAVEEAGEVGPETEVPACECEVDDDCAEVLTGLGPCEAGFCDPVNCKCRKGTAEDGTACMDGNPCTLTDTCVDGECVGSENVCPCQSDEDCEPLEDGDLCNGTLRCDKSEFPYACKLDPETVVTCVDPEPQPCRRLECVPATGECVRVDEEDGAPCDDGDPCTTDKSCVDGQCTGTAVECADGNPCTSDSCVAGKGCQFLANNLACDDGNECTLGDVCVGGLCVAGEPDPCDDGNPCSQDKCLPGQGCIHSNADGGLCDDGDVCTGPDMCSGGVCKPGPSKDCEDGNPCTDDWCDSDGGCVSDANQAPCEDGDPCTVGDHCLERACVAGLPRECDDGDACTADACDPATGLCVTLPGVNDCDDADTCTVDSCVPETGECRHEAYGCDDGDPCTEDRCVPAGGGPVCAFDPIDCDDGDSETVDSCDAATGDCRHVCDDGDPCTTNEEDPLGGCSFPRKDCDDKDLCTIDMCSPQTGECRHEVPPCFCEDGDACTEERCDPLTGLWANVPLSCDDGDPCTIDSCDPVLSCIHHGKSCDDGNPNTADSCDGQTGDCVHVLVSCEDGNPCTVDHLDAEHQTCSYEAMPCDDADYCTLDSCVVEAGGCVNLPKTCEDCTDPCLVYDCDPTTGLFVVTPVDCGDGDPCTVDACDRLTGDCAHDPLDCDDGDACSADACDPVTGACVHQFRDCDDGNVCDGHETCDPATGACLDGDPVVCDDGDRCTSDWCDPQVGGCVSEWAETASEGPEGDASCTGGLDDDCDGLTDSDDPDCSLAIASVAPRRLPVGVAKVVAIDGTGFGGPADILGVRFGTTPAEVLSVDGGTIRVQLPALPVGRFDVTVVKAHVSVTATAAFTAEGRDAPIAWGNSQWPHASEAIEGGRTEKLFGQVRQPGITPGGDPAAIVAEACIGPAGTLPWESAEWTCYQAGFNVVPPSSPENFEYVVEIEPAPAGRFDLFYRYSVDQGVNWLYADRNGTDDGCTSDQAAKLTVWGVPAPGEAVLNELMWMGTNDISTGPLDKWLEIRNLTGKPFKVRGWTIEGARSGGDVVIGSAEHVVANEVLDPWGYLLVTRQPAGPTTSLAVQPDVVAPDLLLPSPNMSYPTRTFKLRAQGTLLDVAVVYRDDVVHCGENGQNGGFGKDRSMERNDTPGDGSLAASWHTAPATCRPDGAWKGVAPDTGANFGSPRQPNCAP